MDYAAVFSMSGLSKLIAFIIVLIVGYIISKIIESVVAGALRRVGFNRRVEDLPQGNVVRKLSANPSSMVGRFAFWLGIIITVTVALSVLNIPVFNQFLAGVYGYVPNILAAIIILALAIALATAASAVSHRLMGDTPTGRMLAVVLPVLIIAISSFAILEQLKIAPTIVTITYAVLLGSLGLGFALAFGLGGRPVAERLLDQGYELGRRNVDRVRQDLTRGKNRANEEKKRYTE
jgi:hypothetical protein